MLKHFLRRVRRRLNPTLEELCSLRPALSLPQGITEQQLFEFVTSIRVQDAPEEEMRAYGTHDFKRFVYTWGLAKDIKGHCLELGANPYFTTMLLSRFTSLELSLANYFGPIENGRYSQKVSFRDFKQKQILSEEFEYQHFNVEKDSFPYPDGQFDVVVFAEIIEHLLSDPCKVLREVKRVLKPNGSLILTTPNVARLENVVRIIAGANIYDPYSGYGPYGRHNREFNRHELIKLLQYEGFKLDVHFTTDVHPNNSAHYIELKKISGLLKFRENDLGQYIFVRAKKTGSLVTKKPSWLYRSLPVDQLDCPDR
jgi:SAM-dependent methyltransferase